MNFLHVNLCLFIYVIAKCIQLVCTTYVQLYKCSADFVFVCLLIDVVFVCVGGIKKICQYIYIVTAYILMYPFIGMLLKNKTRYNVFSYSLSFE